MTRLLPFQKVKTSLSVTSFASLLLSTVHLETMRIKLAKTAVKSGIENTTAPSNATLPRISSVASVEMLVTWPEIALTDSGVLTGAMALHRQEACLVAQVLQQVELALAIWLTARWR